MKLKFYLSALAVILFNTVYGQEEQNDSIRSYQLDQVVITGARLPLEKGRIPASITVVGEEEIENQNQTNVLSVINSRVPGLFLNERGMVGFGVGPKSGGGIGIRGLASSGDPANTRTLVLVDGQPQFMGVFGHPIHDSYFSANVERVEVIRGPASILYGSNAMGGVINIITRQQQKEGFDLNAKAAYGSFNTFESDLTLGYKKDRFHVMTAFNHAETEGHREDGNDDFKTTGGYFKAGYRLSNILKTSVDANLSDSRFYDPGTTEMPLNNNYYDFMRGRVAVSMENTTENVEGALRLFYNFGEHDFFDGFHSKDYNTGVTFYQNLKLIENNIITLGVDYKNYGGQASTPAQIKNNRIDESVHETDFYGMLQQTFFDDLNLNLGLRYVINSVYGNIVVPHYGATYAISPNSRVKASVTKGFRSPTLANLYFFPPANEELEPEEMWSYEVGYLQSFFKNKISLELTGFYNEGENLIRVVGPPPPQYVNTGEFEHWGIEFQANYAITNDLHLSGNYSYLNVGTPITLAPKHQLNFHAGYTVQRIRFMVEVSRVSGLYIGAPGGNSLDVTKLSLEDYTLLNAQVHYPFLNYFTIFTRVNNILDQDYMIDKGYPLPGINTLMGVRLRF